MPSPVTSVRSLRSPELDDARIAFVQRTPLASTTPSPRSKIALDLGLGLLPRRVATRAARVMVALAVMLLTTETMAGNGDLRPPTLGASGAVVEIVEFSDFECPYCARGRRTMKSLQQTYGDKLKVTFVHLPLAFHRNAHNAAKASVAAQRQGQFWSMNELLFASSRSLSDARYLAAARELKLDLKRFGKDLADPAVDAFVTRNAKIAAALGATGTPTFFVNGQKVRGAQPAPKFAEIIDAELAAYKAAPKPGFIKARTLSANPDLSRYLHAWETPPDRPASKTARARRAERTIPDDVFRASVDTRKDPIQGPKDAPVTLVAFADFECPFCSKHAVTIDTLRERYPNDLRVVFKHKPLAFHKGAKPLALAGICAKAQGKFWAFHDAALAANGKPDRDAVIKAAKLNRKRLAKCLKRKTTLTKLQADEALSRQLGVRGTPHVFVNGRSVRGAVGLTQLESVFKEELAKAKKVIAGGVKAQDVYAHLMKDAKVIELVEGDVIEGLNKDAPRRGAKRAKAVITIFSDFECPFCARAQGLLAKLEKEHKGKIAVVHRNMPLSHHKRAQPAALAAMCANDQGKFWAYHDRLFTNTKDLSDEALLAHAAALKLDSKKFGACFEDKTHSATVDADMKLARRANVRGTPTFFINGRKLKNAGSDALNAAVSDALKGKL